MAFWRELGRRRSPEVIPNEVTVGERREVVDAFNQYYLWLHGRSLVRQDLYGNDFNTVKAGVEKAVGKKVADPQNAIPADYAGDGSFLSDPFDIENGTKTKTQTEYIPLPAFGGRKGAPYYDILMAHSRRFIEAHPEDIDDRTKLEAYYAFKRKEKVRLGSHKSDYDYEEWKLQARWEFMLPVVGTPKTR